MQHIEHESNEGREAFSRIAQDENKRVQQLADKENERILQEMRENGTIKMCPICLEEIPAIQSHEDCKRGTCSMVMTCCGVAYCTNCTDKFIDDIAGKENAKCYNCREPFHHATYYANTIKSDDKRHWILRAVAAKYMNGTCGLKKDTEKAMKLCKRAAE